MKKLSVLFAWMILFVSVVCATSVFAADRVWLDNSVVEYDSGTMLWSRGAFVTPASYSWYSVERQAVGNFSQREFGDPTPYSYATAWSNDRSDENSSSPPAANAAFYFSVSSLDQDFVTALDESLRDGEVNDALLAQLESNGEVFPDNNDSMGFVAGTPRIMRTASGTAFGVEFFRYDTQDTEAFADEGVGIGALPLVMIAKVNGGYLSIIQYADEDGAAARYVSDAMSAYRASHSKAFAAVGAYYLNTRQTYVGSGTGDEIYRRPDGTEGAFDYEFNDSVTARIVGAYHRVYAGLDFFALESGMGFAKFEDFFESDDATR